MWSSYIPFPLSSCYGNHMSSIPPSFAWLVRIVLYLPQIRPIISWHVWTEANYRYSPHGGVHLATIYLWTRSQVVSQKCPQSPYLFKKNNWNDRNVLFIKYMLFPFNMWYQNYPLFIYNILVMSYQIMESNKQKFII